MGSIARVNCELRITFQMYVINKSHRVIDWLRAYVAYVSTKK